MKRLTNSGTKETESDATIRGIFNKLAESEDQKRQGKLMKDDEEGAESVEMGDLISKRELLRSLRGNVTPELEEEVRRQPTAPGIGIILQELERKETEAEERAARYYEKGGSLGMMIVHEAEASACRSAIDAIRFWNNVS